MPKENLNAEEVQFVASRVSGSGCDLLTINQLCWALMENGGLSRENGAILEAMQATAQRAGHALDNCLKTMGTVQVGGFDHYEPEVTS